MDNLDDDVIAPTGTGVLKDAEHLSIVFIGHVDAGKSTISGQVLVLSGLVDQRTIEKYEREAIDKNRASWYLAYIMDVDEEERVKGITVEVGRATFETEKRRFTILDAPGHKNYVPNMIAGTAQADVAVLVISARRGEFEAGFERGGQTREHAMLAMTLGVRKLIVLVNKMDEPTVQWTQERFQQIVDGLTSYLKQLQFSSGDVYFVPVSGLKGDNLKLRSTDPRSTWYSGPTLFDLLDTLPLPPRDATLPLRLPILGNFKESGKDYLLGKVEQGTLSIGSKVVLIPSKLPATVSNIFIDNSEVSVAKPGENVRCVLDGIRDSAAFLNSLSSGGVICSEKDHCREVSVLECQLHLVETLPTKQIITNGYACVMHILMCSVDVQIAKLLTLVDGKTKEVKEKQPRFVKKGALLTCMLKLARPIACDLFKNSRMLGRFTLRDEGVTIGIGRISKLPPDNK